jgi:hypothetical protein
MRPLSGSNDMSRDEIGTLFAARFVSKISARTPVSSLARRADWRRAVEVASWIDAHAHHLVSLEDMALQANAFAG